MVSTSELKPQCVDHRQGDVQRRPEVLHGAGEVQQQLEAANKVQNFRAKEKSM